MLLPSAVSRIVKTFLAMARQQPARTSNVWVNDILEAALEVVGYSIRSSDIRSVAQIVAGSACRSGAIQTS